MKKYKAVIYDIDGTLLNTLNMNMYPLMKIIKEETGEDWTFEQVLKFAPYPGMKVMQDGFNMSMIMKMKLLYMKDLKKFLKVLKKRVLNKLLFHQN